MDSVQINPTWNLAVAVVLLVGSGALTAKWARLGLGRQMLVAALRAVTQLTVVSSIVVLAVQRWWSGLLFVLVMFAIAVWTTTGRVKTRNAWPWSALALACGVLPVLLIIFITGTAPFNGYTIIPIGSIIVGNMMTAHTLTGRTIFAELRENIRVYEAGLALGFTRPPALELVIHPVRQEAMIPNIDSTRTVGLVTLPGAFIGVLLGGGTPLQAGASQIMVLLGIMAGQGFTVAVAQRLIMHGRLLPVDLKSKLHV